MELGWNNAKNLNALINPIILYPFNDVEKTTFVTDFTRYGSRSCHDADLEVNVSRTVTIFTSDLIGLDVKTDRRGHFAGFRAVMKHAGALRKVCI